MMTAMTAQTVLLIVVNENAMASPFPYTAYQKTISEAPNNYLRPALNVAHRFILLRFPVHHSAELTKSRKLWIWYWLGINLMLESFTENGLGFESARV